MYARKSVRCRTLRAPCAPMCSSGVPVEGVYSRKSCGVAVLPGGAP
jgi:hypothetical protein